MLERIESASTDERICLLIMQALFGSRRVIAQGRRSTAVMTRGNTHPCFSSNQTRMARTLGVKGVSLIISENMGSSEIWDHILRRCSRQFNASSLLLLIL